MLITVGWGGVKWGLFGSFAVIFEFESLLSLKQMVQGPRLFLVAVNGMIGKYLECIHIVKCPVILFVT